jgi:predicted nuclease of predicted toxin-antitoxin system
VARFYSNENLAIVIVQNLRSYGHDVLTSYEAGQANQGIPDREVLIFATTQNRILITFNRDDFIELHRSGITHTGIIICKDDRDYVGQAKFLNDFLQAQTPELCDRLVRVQKQNQSKSNTQVFITREYVR